MRRTALLLAATVFVLATATAALATHQPNHPQPAACDVSQGLAPYKNPHCTTGYPPGQLQGQGQKASRVGKKASFQFPERSDGAITVGMLIIAGLGAFTVLLAARAVVRRRLIS